MRFIKKEYRKYWILSVWIIIIGYMVFSFGIVGGDRNSSLCSSIIVSIESQGEDNFITENEIIQLLKNKNQKITGTPMIDINTAIIEKIVSGHVLIKRADVYKTIKKRADVYKTIKGELKIDIEQRKPIIRIISKTGQSLYLDEDGVPMPASKHYTAHVMVAGGNIPGFDFSQFDDNATIPVVYQQLYEIAGIISENELWIAQIDQIYVNRKNEIELVSRIGDHTIRFGTFNNYRRKLAKLEALYKQGFSKYGWKKYKTINLKYKDQVVCTKR